MKKHLINFISFLFSVCTCIVFSLLSVENSMTGLRFNSFLAFTATATLMKKMLCPTITPTQSFHRSPGRWTIIKAAAQFIQIPNFMCLGQILELCQIGLQTATKRSRPTNKKPIRLDHKEKYWMNPYIFQKTLKRARWLPTASYSFKW